MVGVDKSIFHLSKAKEICISEKTNITLIQKDMRDYLMPNSFDLILNLFTSFGYFRHRIDDQKLIQNMYSNLKESGKVVMDITGKETIPRIFQGTISSVLESGVMIVQRHEIVNDWSEIDNEWIILKNNEYKTHNFRLRLYSAIELENMFEGCGFKSIKIFGNLNGVKYDNNSLELVLVAEK